MSRTFSPAARGNLSLVLSALALLVAMSGTAYALANGSIKARHLASNSVTTPKIKDGAVTAPKIKNGAVTGPKIADGSLAGADVADGSLAGADVADGSLAGADVTDGSLAGADLADGAVDGATVADGSLRLSDLGGSLTDQTSTVSSAVPIAANECTTLSLRLFNPAPNGLLGSMVVGTITSAGGGPVVNNTGVVVPTLLTETTQGGALIRLGVCAGSSAQTIPAGAIVTWSIVEP